MRVLFIFWACLLTSGVALSGSRSEKNLRFAAEQLDRALEQKDTLALNRLLSEKLSYGHSNGWIETKQEVKAHLFNGRLSYQRIQANGKPPFLLVDGRTGVVRNEVTIDVLLDGRPLNIKLSVLQVWIFSRGSWHLLARQSTKV